MSPAYGAPVNNQYAWGIYASYQATEKMSFHVRGETIREQGDVAGSDNEAYALTGTVQYNLWENVISRAEIRWDHADQPAYGQYGASSGGLRNAVMLAANLIYKF
ncbi:MAG: outer membrane beta-barrel protein [Verrucomicrobiota bacterium]